MDFTESSAQTLPFLPEVTNDPAELNALEIFKFPSVITANSPLGLYEVDVLERARKRWMFAKALKEHFRQQLESAKEQAKLQKHEHILEAFEWKYWIEREENIQECQMLRLELLIRMFDKRERDMHITSKARIHKNCQDIETRRNSALKKNKTEYSRNIRRLKIKHKKQSRVWRKESIAHELDDPTSEYYAPQMRYGVNPNRRHYLASRNGFDTRIDSLETKATLLDFKNLKCPFSKLRQWSKPKETLQEVEQNFCSDANLNRLYGSLKILRESSKKHKHTPFCLKTKKRENTAQPEVSKVTTQIQMTVNVTADRTSMDVAELSFSEDHQKYPQYEVGEYFEQLLQQKQTECLNKEKLQKERRCEELETLISSYQGNTIGWLMRFLTEEMSRLKEQRKLQLLAVLAKRKRWRCEAAEAGLRQKENCVRETYEEIYEECDVINKATTQSFLESILKPDIKDYARQNAEQHILILAKDLDKEISDWLKSFDKAQIPYNYHILRQSLKNIVMPDAEKMLYRLNRDACIDYIINDVLMDGVYYDLESYDISFSLASDFVDRLIDNDIFLSSSDCSSDCECEPPCTCSRGQQEANAIIRKVLRRAVPGRRWFTEEERTVEENVRDLLADVFSKVITDNSIIEVDLKTQPRTSCRGAHTDLICYDEDFKIEELIGSPSPAACQDNEKLKLFNYASKICADDVTKHLKWSEQLLLTDPDKMSSDDYIIKKRKYLSPETAPKLSIIYNIPSYHDLSRIDIFRKTPTFTQTSSEELLERMVLEQEEDIKEETLMLHEGSSEELGFIGYSSCEKQPVKHAQEQNEQEEQENEIVKDSSEESRNKQPKVSISQQYSNTVKDASRELTAQKFSTKPTVHIRDKTVIEKFDAESVQEDDSSGFMRVSFTYDPQLKFSVAMPTIENDDKADR